jgi:O-antigen ligase
MKAFSKNWPIALLFGLLIALLLQGGASREGLMVHLIIHAVSWAGLVGLLVSRGAVIWQSAPRVPVLLFVGLLAWTTITLMPLPPDLALHGRIGASIETERALLGVTHGGTALSRAPFETLRSLVGFGTPLFALLVVAELSDKARTRLVQFLIGLGLLSIVLGFGQVFAGRDSPLYFWEISNRGSAVGIFANANHQTSFSALLIPLVLFLVARYGHKFREGDEGLGLALLLFASLILVIVGLVSAGSVAGYGLGLFALLSSLVLFIPQKGQIAPSSGLPRSALLLPLGLVLAAGLLVFSSPRLSGLGVTSFAEGETTRQGITSRSLTILEDNLVAGTGLGSFEEVYPLYEDQETVSATFINHAHNDWLEWVIELGIPGFLLLVAFLVWGLWNTRRLMFTADVYKGKRLSQAATIGCYVSVLHSLVDYPLRTPFYAAVFAVLLGLAVTKPFKLQAKTTHQKNKPRQVTL